MADGHNWSNFLHCLCFIACKHINRQGFLRIQTIILGARIWKECGPGSSVSIATDYGVDGPGIESRWVEILGIPVVCVTMK